LAADDSPHANPSIKQQNSYKLYLKFLFICQENGIACIAVQFCNRQKRNGSQNGRVCFFVHTLG
jgi:hypothetical protein